MNEILLKNSTKVVLIFFIFSVYSFSKDLNVGIFSGTFDPPHGGHVAMIKEFKKKFALDSFYIITNVTSEHKSNVTAYRHRKRMAQIAFGSIEGAIVGDKKIEAAFLVGDMDEVVKVIRSVHPHAQLYQVMGDDSLARLLKVMGTKKKTLDNINIVVNKRDGGVVIPKSINGANVIEFDSQTPADSSSRIRKELLIDPKMNSNLDEKVYEYIKSHKLYFKSEIIPACLKRILL
ncbi:MAG: hypothetical protein A2381_18745 [Bdellovibrionales bacterium RIFOXYB1_FULL_37_110]|nr:MAG: hypothetical protein A2181_05300 [Bdellovibrionales bacterium RIFOXYA1_FULL_38_20]OFZ51998.1 MAG: hypothetical protein A2417_05095 [Bdellovibrionales bacterium RIFOXYC1_FULL_37_79]OFZ60576.1 MAG: hypothetical protein A2381_18745 [Bdellovibrionales bacterium RIFOXYB1_FULL_37_110]OFZ61767.1 MAG: hypothetical protein A2577_19665 [Bdellovibrionales bacterium RIFOXYD1_FULL_36_51]